MIQAISKFRKGRTDVGVWAPSCVQHGFTDTSTFTSDNFRVPGGFGSTAAEAIEKFLKSPEEGPWLVDEVEWPLNSRCNGYQQSNLVKQK